MRIATTCLLVFASACFAQQAELGDPPQSPDVSFARTSSKLNRPQAQAITAQATPCWFDTTNRSAIANSYLNSLVPNSSVPMGWTGSFSPPNPGTTSAAWKTAVVNQINWIRAFAGVPCITGLDASKNAGDQDAAFMMMTNGQLNHTPPSSWLNWTQAGATAAGKSNLCFGFLNDPGCVRQYMVDSGSGNSAAGHRRWILYPQTTTMGTGDVPSNGSQFQMANALGVIDTATYGGPRPATRDGYVAWPPPGYLPYQLLPGRWSFSYPSADFSAATVTMTRNGASIPITLEPVANGYGENTIVFIPGTAIATPPAADVASTVTISNVRIGGVAQTYTYQVTVFNPSNAPAQPTADSVSPSTGSGMSQTFTFKYSSGSGFRAINAAYALFNSSLNAAGGCEPYYVPNAGLYLLNDAGTAASGPIAAGTAGTLQNSQCSINTGASSVTGSGNTLTMNLNVSFTSAFTGAKTVYLYAADTTGQNSGWQSRGTWTVPGTAPGPPTADSVSPSSGTGSNQTFSFKYSSSGGYTKLSTVYGLFNSSLSATNGCYAYYLPASNQLYLYNDAGSSASGPVTPGSAGTLQNSQCTINSAASSVSGAGTTLTLNLNVAFASGFAGAKSTYMYASDVAGLNSGWQTRGTWTIPGTAAAAPTADSVSPNAGFGRTQTFTFKYSSAGGFGKISAGYALFNSSRNGANGCYVYYVPSVNGLYLYNDAGTTVMGPVTPGGLGTLTNSQCTINTLQASVNGLGNTLTVNISITFNPAFAGAKSVYMLASDVAGLNSGWQTKGTWTVQ